MAIAAHRGHHQRGLAQRVQPTGVKVWYTTAATAGRAGCVPAAEKKAERSAGALAETRQQVAFVLLAFAAA